MTKHTDTSRSGELVERLREALREIAQRDDSLGDDARAALGEKQ